MEVEEEELLSESYGGCELSQRELSLGVGSVEEDGGGCCGEESEGDGGVFEVVEVVRGDGAVEVKGLVCSGGDEKLHGYGHGRAKHDEVEL